MIGNRMWLEIKVENEVVFLQNLEYAIHLFQVNIDFFATQPP
jgi:hypothetical protein